MIIFRYIIVILFGSVQLGLSAAQVRGDTSTSPVSMTVSLARESAYGPPADGVTTSAAIRVVGTTKPGAKVGLDLPDDGRGVAVTQADGSGRFTFSLAVRPGAN